MSIRSIFKVVDRTRTPLQKAEQRLVAARRLMRVFATSRPPTAEHALDGFNEGFDQAMDELFAAEQDIKRLRALAAAA